MILFLTIVAVFLVYYFNKNNKFSHLPSPGWCIPWLGHGYKLMTKECKIDPVNVLWKLYKTHQRQGMMYMKIFTLDFLYVGDFETLKYLFNHADCQGRINSNMQKSMREARGIMGKDIPGIIWSDGKVWEEQRRFTRKMIRYFQFGKKGL